MGMYPNIYIYKNTWVCIQINIFTKKDEYVLKKYIFTKKWVCIQRNICTKKRWVCIQKGRGTSSKQHLSFPFAGLWPCNPAVLGGGVEAATDNSKAEKAVCPGRAEEQQVLGEEVQEQRGSQEVPRGSSPEGKPDRHESALPRGGEHRAQGGGGALEKGKFRLETDDDGPWGQAQFHGGKSLICCRVNLKCNVITTDVRLVTRNSKWYDVVPAAMIGSGAENPQQPPSLSECSRTGRALLQTSLHTISNGIHRLRMTNTTSHLTFWKSRQVHS